MIRVIESYTNALLNEMEDVAEALGSDKSELDVLRLQTSGIKKYINKSLSKLNKSIGGLLHENINTLNKLGELLEGGRINNKGLANSLKDLAAANKKLLEEIAHEQEKD